jgi:hypothetical protein
LTASDTTSNVRSQALFKLLIAIIWQFDGARFKVQRA